MKNFIKSPLLGVLIGGAIGSILRYGVAEWLSFIEFPIGTMAVNLTGCFLLGYWLFHPYIKEKLPSALFTAISTGVIGSFTTFSTLIMEIFMLTQENILSMLWYISIQVVGGVALSYGGTCLARKRSKAQ